MFLQFCSRSRVKKKNDNDKTKRHTTKTNFLTVLLDALK